MEYTTSAAEHIYIHTLFKSVCQLPLFQMSIYVVSRLSIQAVSQNYSIYTNIICIIIM